MLIDIFNSIDTQLVVGIASIFSIKPMITSLLSL